MPHLLRTDGTFFLLVTYDFSIPQRLLKYHATDPTLNCHRNTTLAGTSSTCPVPALPMRPQFLLRLYQQAHSFSGPSNVSILQASSHALKGTSLLPFYDSSLAGLPQHAISENKTSLLQFASQIDRIAAWANS